MAQSASPQMGARAHAMGNASACVSDIWSVNNNIAGLAEVSTLSGSASYHSLPSFKHFNRMALAFAVPMNSGVAGAGVFRFGDDLYNEQMLSLGFANTWGLASLGIKGAYIQYRAEGVGIKRAFTFSFGGKARITPELFFGAYIRNVNQPVIDSFTDERVPTNFVAGLAFKPGENLTAALEVEKAQQDPPTWKAGFEYHPLKVIRFRSGLNVHPESAFFGIGFVRRKFDLDYAIQFNRAFGTSHQATVSFSMDQK